MGHYALVIGLRLRSRVPAILADRSYVLPRKVGRARPRYSFMRNASDEVYTHTLSLSVEFTNRPKCEHTLEQSYSGMYSIFQHSLSRSMHTPRLPALAPLQTALFDREANVLLDHQRRLSPDAVDMLLALAPYVCPTAIILHVEAGHLVPSAPTAAAAAADWPPGPPHVRNFVGAFLLAETPGAQGGEDVAEHGPQRREVGDVDGDGGLAEVPVELDVGD